METKINEEYQKLIDKLKEVREANLMGSDKALIDEVIYCLSILGKRPILSDNVEQFMSITQNMAKTYAAKNHDYGNSFEQSLDKFGLVASVVRLGDKMNRIESLTKKEAQVKDESIKDTLLDLASYSVMTLMWLNKQQK
nr:MAG TPA: Nucleotide modification associated domain 1 [Caudoviricetes sp.]